MADNLQTRFCLKHRFFSPHHEMTEYFYDKQTIFLVRRKKYLKPRDVCICCIQELIHPNENTCFWYVIAHSYRGLKNFTEKKDKKIGQVCLLY